ncbi:MAG: hypothetical protein WBK43_09355 [Prolixibacteraceae bacterium]|nr:hypothetical protein [Prolixibacteraceae bacterium]HOR99869.1 hypothetical protein [Prolixibacteraceae bacterium]HOS89759.1 hypothetical protein [Prolixibacteraceae bacterium]HPL44761.1 hypothetical protein [Prolixibacteraceae bacterium]HQE51320.1 hypothetical protein [Prolixibacteraceae bacterium]
METANLYPVFLSIHHYLSWGVVLVLILAAGKAWKSLLFKNRWTSTDTILASLLTVGADLQLLLGIVLYAALSPVTRQAFNNFGAAIADPGIRFFAVEHIAMMVVAVIILYIVKSRVRKAQFNARKHRMSAIWYTVALALVLFSIPWGRIFS